MRTASTELMNPTNELSNDDTIVVAVKTPLIPKATTARMSARLSLQQSVGQGSHAKTLGFGGAFRA